MLEFLGTKISPIGLEIGRDSVKMLQLKSSRSKIAVIAADEIQFSPEIWDNRKASRKAAIEAIRSILARGHFQNRQVISCLPSSKLIIRSLRLDTFEDEEIEKTIKSGIIERFGLNTDTHEVRFVCAGDVRQGDEVKNEVIIFAIDRESLREHIAILDQAGVIPVAIDTVPSALFRSLHRSTQQTNGQEMVNVFVDVGASYTTVVIGRAGEIIFAKQIDVASEQINRQIASRLGIGIDEAIHLRSKLRNKSQAVEIEPAMLQMVVDSINSVVDELAREISLCFRYYAVTFRGHRPGKVVFAGSEAYEQMLISALEQYLGIEIKVTEPLKGFDISCIGVSPDKKTMLYEWAVAAGLCLKGMNINRKDRSYERN